MPLREVLESELRTLHVDLTSEQILVLARYCDELTRWNTRMNLTALRGRDLVRRLVVEPAWIAAELRMSGTLADIGSGNGSPAIPFHVAAQLKSTYLIEARAKRAAFLRHVVNFLELQRIRVHRARLEEAEMELADLDWVSLQGVALTRELLETIRNRTSSTTKVVWITSSPKPPIEPVQTLLVPATHTEALVFQLDLP
jgi:16S rRNA (guanine(527)-N(7))-methyltransferase RsmG